ncbi:hypothetical protein CEXT_427081 [Caerostris extrusa]|uniref:Uncharacterized protein n=1 Tax=Caerostris extrusa TaxID=172846 RepID=A0AAV4THP7_CAEEX|nr:hypothetical protein CEXT_427081 [Caerostris extrusa]
MLDTQMREISFKSAKQSRTSYVHAVNSSICANESPLRDAASLTYTAPTVLTGIIDTKTAAERSWCTQPEIKLQSFLMMCSQNSAESERTVVGGSTHD